MNFRYFKILFLFLLSGILSQSCSSDDNDNSQIDDDMQEQAEAIVVSGNWRISSYVDSGDDETNDYNGYVFTFLSNGTVRADNGTRIQAGVWSVSSSNSQDNESFGNLEFNLFFDVAADDIFEDLNDDWDVVDISTNTISLIDVSGDSGETDNLVFQKN